MYKHYVSATNNLLIKEIYKSNHLKNDKKKKKHPLYSKGIQTITRPALKQQ